LEIESLKDFPGWVLAVNWRDGLLFENFDREVEHEHEDCCEAHDADY